MVKVVPYSKSRSIRITTVFFVLANKSEKTFRA